MKNFYILFLLISMVCTTATAQNVQPVEVTVQGGMTVPLDKYQDYTNKVGYGFGIELRYNFRNSPWDCGIMADFTSANHDYVPHGWNENAIFSDHKETWGIAAVGDYNFRQGKAINPFAGCGIGVAFNSSHGEVMRDAKGTSALFVPRIGVELLHHIRLTASCHLCRKGFNTFDLSIGLTLGGRPRK